MEAGFHNPEAGTVRYAIIPERSRFTVQAFAAGALAGFARNPTFAVRRFSGRLCLSPSPDGRSSIELTVQADSLELLGEFGDKDRREISTRMLGEALETRRFPTITFSSTAIESAKITENRYRLRIPGRLFLHGVTRPVQIDARLQTAFRETRLSGECTLSPSVFGIPRVAALGGLIKLKDELKFSFDLFARREEGETR